MPLLWLLQLRRPLLAPLLPLKLTLPLLPLESRLLILTHRALALARAWQSTLEAALQLPRAPLLELLRLQLAATVTALIQQAAAAMRTRAAQGRAAGEAVAVAVAVGLHETAGKDGQPVGGRLPQLHQPRLPPQLLQARPTQPWRLQ